MSYTNGQRHAHVWRLVRRRQKDAGPPMFFWWTCHCTAVKTVIIQLKPETGQLVRKAYVTTDDGIEPCGPAPKAEPELQPAPVD